MDAFTFPIGKNRFYHNLSDNIIPIIPPDNFERYIVKMFGNTFCIDNKLIIEASTDLTKFEIVYLDTIRIPINLESENILDIMPIGKKQLNLTWSLFMFYSHVLDANCVSSLSRNEKIEKIDERILFILKLILPNEELKGFEYRISKIDEFIENFIQNNAEKISMTTSDGIDQEIRASKGRFFRYDTESGLFNIPIDYYKIMNLNIKLLPKVGPLYDSLSVNLTRPGGLQLNFLKNHLKNLHSIFQSGSFYAPFTGIIQSSGFGKTKLCLDLLQTNPGIYFVFRESTNTGVPQMKDWMVKFADYVISADTDDLPLEKDMSKFVAINSTPGRFLLALSEILESYKNILENIISFESTESEIKAAITKIGSYFAAEPKNDESEEIKILFNAKNIPTMTIKAVSEKIYQTLSSITNRTKTSDYPFLLFLDELDVFNYKRAAGRISGLNIVRRALHCLGNLTNLFALAIGTNSDALDFSPTVRDNSLRFVNRPNILPPFILSGNWDIFSSTVKYEDIILNENSLLNLTMLNILFSFGRPVWSSCKISDVMTVAMAKMRNGFSDSNGARLAQLMARANLTVNVHHVLARTLVRSYMTIVNYVSTDANDMKISYSSEPVLALAARFLLNNQSARLQAFQAIKEFLFQKAMDKGRILETLFEHLILFCIDDADFHDLKFSENPTIPEFPSDVQEKLTKCQNFLLECQANLIRTAVFDTSAATSISTPQKSKSWQQQNPILSRLRNQFYRVIKLEKMILKMLNGEENLLQIIKRTISEKSLNALIGTTHFVQLDVARTEDFGNLENFVEVKPTERNVIDKSLLKVGVLRQCGYTMQPNYFGIDFILPISIRRYVKEKVSIADSKGSLANLPNDSNVDDIFSFIAVQSKSSKQNLVECTFKMSGLFHLNRCPNSKHFNETQCIKSKCKAYMKMSDIITILEDQVVILLTASSPKTRSSKTTVCLKGRKKTKLIKEKEEIMLEILLSSTSIAEDKKTSGSAAKRPKISKTKPDKIVEDVFKSFDKEISNFVPDLNRENVISVNFPSYFSSNNIRSDLRPDCIITKNLSDTLTLQKMIWDYSEDEIELLLSENLAKTKKKEGAKIEVEEFKEKYKDSGKPKKRLSVTCIAVNDISFFEHLVSENGIAVTREIIDFSVSNFQNVDFLHKPIVQNSMLNGLFSPYYTINPTLQKNRGDDKDFPIIDDLLENYGKVFTEPYLKASIDSCILGPIDKTVPKLDDGYFKIISEQINNLNIENYKLKLIQEDFDEEEEDEEDEEYDEKANLY